MIRGYPRQPSPVAGGEVVLHVATDAPEFRVEFYRYGAEFQRHGVSEWQPGRDAPPHLPYSDWGEQGRGLDGEPLAPWPAYRFALPEAGPPGVYVAVLVEGDGWGGEASQPDRSTPDGRDARALFVVRPRAPTPGALLYKLPVLTYFAYDVVHGELFDPRTRRGLWCFYNPPLLSELPEEVPRSLGLHKPGGGTGGVPYDIGNWDPFDPTPRQTFVHWDGPFVRWLERSGYAVDYCTDVDLHRQGHGLLRPYRLLVSAGHDEYWSDTMRGAVEAHVDEGGGAAFFSGNTLWWRVVFDDEHTFRRVTQWGADPERSDEPENTLLGTSFRNGGERDRDEHPVPVGFRVQHADSWVYAGTGLADGDVFGDGPHEYLVGYECDGALFDRADLGAGRPVRPSRQDGTPSGFQILGVGDLAPSGWGLGNGAATMGVLRRGAGTVFNAATTDWARLLDRSPAVERITRNVLDRLGRPE
ncbi:MAG: hypothetical protein M3P46_06865 [Actinomycetota bacterium]|nr:hypothetical protein [Actinomycetota bacterium]